MKRRRPTTPRAAVLLGLALAATVGTTRPASAQFLDTDPYKPWNWMYQPFVAPSAAGLNPALPNQNRLGDLGDPNRMRGFNQSLDGAGDNLFGRGSGRLERDEYRRSIGLGEGMRRGGDGEDALDPDEQFYRDKQERDRRYVAAMKEKDPAKRARMLQEWQADSRRASLRLSPDRTRRRSPAETTGTARPANGATRTRPSVRASSGEPSPVVLPAPIPRNATTAPAAGPAAATAPGTSARPSSVRPRPVTPGPRTLRSPTDTYRRSLGLDRSTRTLPTPALPDNNTSETPSAPAVDPR